MKPNLPRFTACLALVALCFLSSSLHAVPSYARQTGLSCIACHTEFPILTEFGRNFKLNGYTMSVGETKLPPLAVMVLPSFTQTQKGQEGGAGPHFGRNSNLAISQASLFYAGRLLGPYAEDIFPNCPALSSTLNKIGVFFQATYDGVGRQFLWDNAEIRYADHGTLLEKPVTYGFYVNNNPTLQDPWNTIPAWTYPFTSSGLAASPSAATLIEGGLSQQVVGVGAYLFVNNSVYVDIAGYHTLDTGFQRAMGVSTDGENNVSGVAPYWRLAYTRANGNQSFEVGLFGLAASFYPGRVNSAGEDHLIDQGFDAQYQTSFGKNDITALFSTIYEWQDWHASEQLGNTSNKNDHLWSSRLAVDYLYDKTYGGAVGYFLVDGSDDAALNGDSANGSPLSDGLVFQINYLPLNKAGGPSFWEKSNVKFSVQYVLYNRFNGSSKGASDNNTLYLESWIAF